MFGTLCDLPPCTLLSLSMLLPPSWSGTCSWFKTGTVLPWDVLSMWMLDFTTHLMRPHLFLISKISPPSGGPFLPPCLMLEPFPSLRYHIIYLFIVLNACMQNTNSTRTGVLVPVVYGSATLREVPGVCVVASSLVCMRSTYSSISFANSFPTRLWHEDHFWEHYMSFIFSDNAGMSLQSGRAWSLLVFKKFLVYLDWKNCF